MDTSADLGDLPKENSQLQINAWLVKQSKPTPTPTYSQMVTNNNTTDTNSVHNDDDDESHPTPRPSRKERTFTFFNLTSQDDMTTPVADALANLFQKPAESVIDKLQRDTRFRSRYHVVLRTKAQHDKLTEQGITVAGQRIRGLAERTRALQAMIEKFYIPNFPAWGSKRELVELLEPHGEVVFVRERRSNKYGFALGGWFIGMRNVDGPLESVRYEDQDFHVHALNRPRQTPQQRHPPSQQDEMPPPPPQPQEEEHEEEQQQQPLTEEETQPQPQQDQQEVPTNGDPDKQIPPPAPPMANTITPRPFVVLPKLTVPSISFGEEQPLSAAENDRLKSLDDIPGDKISGKKFAERMMLQNRKQAFGTIEEPAPFGAPTNFDHQSEGTMTGEEEESGSSGRSHLSAMSTSGLVRTKRSSTKDKPKKKKKKK